MTDQNNQNNGENIVNPTTPDTEVDVTINTNTSGRTISEEITALGSQAVQQVRQLVDEGNVRRLIIKDATTDKTLIDTQLTFGLGVGLGVAFFAPAIALIAGIAAAFSRIKIIVERETDIT